MCQWPVVSLERASPHHEADAVLCDRWHFTGKESVIFSLYFTNNHKGIHMSDRLLTDGQLTQAVELFAQGQSRTQVAAHFIDNDLDIRQAETTAPKGLRERLSNALRVADLTSKQFSEKFREHYKLHTESVKEVLQSRYDRAVLNYVDFLDTQILQVTKHIETLNYMLATGNDDPPQDLSERNATKITAMRLTEHLGRLHKQHHESLKLAIETPTPPATEQGDEETLETCKVTPSETLRTAIARR